MKHLSSLSSLLHRYDAFILDLWGVIHDGVVMYPQALDTLEQLKAAGKRVLFLSNAPRRASAAIAKLDHLGVNRSLYEKVITSGEAAFEFLAHSPDQWKERCYFIGLEMDRHVLEHLAPAYQFANSVEHADFILCAGYESLSQAPEKLDSRLQQAAGLKLPMLCINPDIEVVRQSGERILCAGHLAQNYAAMGGEVTYIGKPYPLVYAACMEHFSAVPKERILAVGDGLGTDIKGANAVALDSLLITGGILKQRVGDKVSEAAVEAACRARGAWPNYVLPAFA